MGSVSVRDNEEDLQMDSAHGSLTLRIYLIPLSGTFNKEKKVNFMSCTVYSN